MSMVRTLKSAADILDAELLPADASGLASLKDLERVAARYAVAITPAMAELIDAADPHDPIARQFLPDAAELHSTPEERADPIGDGVHEAMPGLVHRYPDRVLLKLANICAVYCRFCFRREMVGPGKPAHLSDEAIDAALAYVAAHPEIWEVIVSGGDPLVLSPRRLAAVSRSDRGHPACEGAPLAQPGPARRAGARRCGADRRPQACGRDGVARDPCEPPERIHRRRMCGPCAACRCRHPAGEPDRASEGRQ